MGRESNFWALKQQAYIPSAVFKLFCASETKQLFQFPKFFYAMRQETQANEEIRQQLLDLRKKTPGFKKRSEGDLDPERSERAVVDSQL